MKFLITSIVARSLALLLLLGAVTPTFAQDAQGNDTPGDWVVTHYKPYGLWDSVCDQAMRDGVMIDRCYLRYVDVFSPAPKFAAQFVFIIPQKNGFKVEFGIEKGTLFKGEGLRVVNDGKIVWKFDPNNCLNFGSCIFEGKEAVSLIDIMSKSYQEKSVLMSDFSDRHGANQLLEWDLDRFSDAISDFKTQSHSRGLLG